MPSVIQSSLTPPEGSHRLVFDTLVHSDRWTPHTLTSLIWEGNPTTLADLIEGEEDLWEQTALCSRLHSLGENGTSRFVP